uniref:Uncharacterized protein n=1 Tax=Octopus bimaculoides TaxID=37653 RepID=A0A0L8IDG0_OCTBM
MAVISDLLSHGRKYKHSRNYCIKAGRLEWKKIRCPITHYTGRIKRNSNSN